MIVQVISAFVGLENFLYTGASNIYYYRSGLNSFFDRVSQHSDHWVGVILRDEGLAQDASHQGLYVLRLGDYFLIKKTPWEN